MLLNIQLLLEACDRLDIKYEVLHADKNLVCLDLDRRYYFCNYQTPFNPESVSRILKDKDYTYELLKDCVQIPVTQSFLSPFCEEKYRKYLKFESIGAIVSEITAQFQMPVIIKRNAGASGNNVFLCQPEQIEPALLQIFNLNSKDFDYIALAQDYIAVKREYRAVFFAGTLLLLYEKDFSDAKFVGNLSPLHWEDSKARLVTNAEFYSAIEQFLQPVFQKINPGYCGVDVVLDSHDRLWLIELNSHPNYEIFVRDNGREPIVQMFVKILNHLQNNLSTP